jgi:endonuclease G
MANEQMRDAINAEARARADASQNEIRRSVAMIEAGVPRAAETDPERLARRLGKTRSLGHAASERLAGLVQLAGKAVEQGGAETADILEKISEKPDFLRAAFLECGALAARSVGRVVLPNGRGEGTGFMISPRLFITNHHVIPSVAQARSYRVEFNFETDNENRPRNVTAFRFDPDACYVTHLYPQENSLDFTILAIGTRHSGAGALNWHRWLTLSDAGDKHAIGEPVNIIQHPDGRLKEIAIHNNNVVNRVGPYLHYRTDTEPGSSGSPVFNNQWEVVALHHAGKFDSPPNHKMATNEGIRISAIVTHLRGLLARLPAGPRALIAAALAGPKPPLDRLERRDDDPGGEMDAVDAPAILRDGLATWRIPVEISVRVGGPPPMAGVTPEAVVAEIERAAEAAIDAAGPNGAGHPNGLALARDDAPAAEAPIRPTGLRRGRARAPTGGT